MDRCEIKGSRKEITQDMALQVFKRYQEIEWASRFQRATYLAIGFHGLLSLSLSYTHTHTHTHSHTFRLDEGIPRRL